MIAGTDQRYYATGMGRFSTPDPAGIRGADPKDPGSWNRYAYVGGDPVNFSDPSGQQRRGCYEFLSTGGELPDDSSMECEEGSGGGLAPWDPPGSNTRSAYPSCNPAGSASEEADLAFVANNYAGAVAAANTVQGALHGINGSLTINTGSLAVTLLQWSASETGTSAGWGTGYLLTTQHNYFGAQVGATGSIACIGQQYVAGSTNACFASSMSFADELISVLSGVPHTAGNPNPSNLSYWTDVLSVLISNPSAGTATITQTIANAGWNASSTYGSKVAGANVQRRLDCLRQYYSGLFQ
jgi:RHS repeat-associated protein